MKIPWAGRPVLFAILLLGFWAGGVTGGERPEGPEPVTLTDFAGFPDQWKIRGETGEANRIYEARKEDSGGILSANVTGEPVRIFLKTGWNPHTHPILTWRWRVLGFPQEEGASIDFYVSLGRDAVGIPTMVKYIWSDHLPVGTEEEGGFFGAAQIVIQTGFNSSGDWITERITALEDYRRLYGEDPGEEAYGIGLLVSTGVEMEISEIVARPADDTPPGE